MRDGATWKWLRVYEGKIEGLRKAREQRQASAQYNRVHEKAVLVSQCWALHANGPPNVYDGEPLTGADDVQVTGIAHRGWIRERPRDLYWMTFSMMIDRQRAARSLERPS